MAAIQANGGSDAEKVPNSRDIDSLSADPLPLSAEQEKTASHNRVDSGLLVWTQCAGSFCLFMGTWGLTNSFGKKSIDSSLQLFYVLTNAL